MKNFGNSLYKVAVLGGAIAASVAPSIAGADEGLTAALTGGKVALDVRYRFENVEQGNALKEANASTVRSRLGYTTGSFYGLNALLELENITAVGHREDYSPAAGGPYSVVGDPIGSQVDQAYLGFSGVPDTTVKLGRQVINLDNQRFVGRVDWRQNGQTFDAVSLANKSLPDTAVTYAFIHNVDTVAAADVRMKSHILNANYSGWREMGIGLSGYAYLLNYDKIPSQSTQTYGVRLAGATNVGEDRKVLYTAEYARQSDFADNPANYGLNYMLGELGGAMNGVYVKLGYEVLQGNGTESVQTPLATLHAFNGWADQFLTTPAAGLKDAYVNAGGAVMGTTLQAAYHDFRTDKGSGTYGTEWDVQAAKTFNKVYTLAAIYADFMADDVPSKVNTRKLWLIGQVSF